MMKFILAKKEGMTQIFDVAGRGRPATVLRAEPGVVTAVPAATGRRVIGFGARKLSRVKKPQRYLSPAAGLGFAKLKTVTAGELAPGSTIDLSIFAPGERVKVSAVSKGKGFQGVVKRHGFKGGPRSHGQKHSEREPGSIGATGPQRVFKGTRMAGRMGGRRVTVANLEVLAVNPTDRLLLLAGAVPGRRGTWVEISGRES